MDERSGKQLFFKCEIFQKVGAFKFRGACNAVFQLTEEDAKKGVVTHSSGNHAQALALAAKMRGIPAHIVMPSNAPQVKKNATKGYGAEIVECEPNLASRETTSQKVIDQTGATMIHPFNNAWIIAGQGTMALELLEEVPDLDAIIAPIGGGGMISGVAIAAKGIKPSIRIIAAEPKGADDAHRSKSGGVLITTHVPNTVADGLLTTMGTLTWPIVRDLVDEVITVEEDEIKAAMRLVFERMKLVIEPSAGVGVAVALSAAFKNADYKKVGIVLCGGNIDLDKWTW
eukprot:TRINITY_DN817_c0_g1_i1.p1 TRINITY_DN817_c0_g1~~TRINITY_DN817_c0_g1_i1.p1  ORF type:complete len:325 (-),score=79.02 TRINITY_DN817_c0_g1_i1:33-890(-)